ncbi:MAG: cytochrome c biogenesis protein ResB [Pyrinomonadaceae bacterium]|nr:cytochrome c biogenesis protein ResB [Pyrinomonadaceae bacterium]
MSAAEETIKAPPSRVPKAALLNRFIAWISSVRFGVALLCILVVLSMVGMLILQQNVSGFDAFYASLTPAEKTIYGALGLFDIYHSWYFNLMLLVLSLNIVLASIDRFPSAWSYIARPKVAATRKWLEAKKFTQTRRYQNKGVQEVADEIAATFKSKGLKPKITHTDEATFVFGESGKWNRLGAYVVHLALIILFMGHWVALQTGFDADVRMVPGQKTEQIQLIEYKLDKKERYNVQLPFAITCTDIQQQLIDEAGPIDVQNTLDWRTQVRIADPAYGTYTADVSLNKPFTYRGYRFFQAQSIPIGNARTITVSLTPENGGAAETIKIQRGEFTTLADGTKVEYADFQPDFTIGPNGQPDTRSSDYKNPAAILNVTPPNGEAVRVFAFAKEIGGNAPIAAPKLGYKWRLSEFEKSPYAHVLSIKYDPYHASFIAWYIGGFGLVGALGFVFFVSHRRVWARIEANEDGSTEAVIAAETNRNPNGMEDKFNQITKELDREDS